jgi:hypothetical protein
MKNARQFIPVIALFVLGLSTIYALGRSRNLRGTIIAYDPMYHVLKQASFVKNLEVTVADLGSTGNPQQLVKVVFEGFGKSQLSQDVLNGEKPFQVHAVRDKSCDEAHPRILSQAESEQAFQGSGTFLLNQVHRTTPLGPVENLVCYRVKLPAEEH